MTRDGLATFSLMLSIKIDEVFEANIVSAATRAATSPSTFCLISKSSTTASTTRSTRSRPE